MATSGSPATILAGERAVNPVLFVVCHSVENAQETASLLAGDAYIGDPSAVLEITSQSSDAALAALADVERPDSPIRAVVSVDKLKEGAAPDANRCA